MQKYQAAHQAIHLLLFLFEKLAAMAAF